MDWPLIQYNTSTLLTIGGHLEFSLRGGGDGHTEASDGGGGHRGPDWRSKCGSILLILSFLTKKDPQVFKLIDTYILSRCTSMPYAFL